MTPPAQGLYQLRAALGIDLAPKPSDLNIDDVVEWSAASPCVPHVLTQHLTRNDARSLSRS
jgi:hypothetical protein